MQQCLEANDMIGQKIAYIHFEYISIEIPLLIYTLFKETHWSPNLSSTFDQDSSMGFRNGEYGDDFLNALREEMLESVVLADESLSIPILWGWINSFGSSRVLCFSGTGFSSAKEMLWVNSPCGWTSLDTNRLELILLGHRRDSIHLVNWTTKCSILFFAYDCCFAWLVCDYSIWLTMLHW